MIFTLSVGYFVYEKYFISESKIINARATSGKLSKTISDNNINSFPPLSMNKDQEKVYSTSDYFVDKEVVWTEYYSLESGIKFAHPADWIIGIDEGNPWLINLYRDVQADSLMTIKTFETNDNLENYYKKSDRNLFSIANGGYENIVIGKYKGYKFIESGEQDTEIVSIKENNKVIEVTLLKSDTLDKDVFAKILDSISIE